MSRPSSFIRRSTRLAIYFRDNFTCVWCRARPDDLTLDHVDPQKRDHDGTNLVTACLSCNSRRRNLPLNKWYKKLRELGHGNPRMRLHRARHRLINQELGRFAANTRIPVNELRTHWRVPF